MKIRKSSSASSYCIFIVFFPILNLLYFSYQNNSAQKLKYEWEARYIQRQNTLDSLILSYPWNKYKYFHMFPDEMRTDFYEKVAKFAELEPLVPINNQCKPPKLLSPDGINCAAFPTAFTGKKRQKIAKIAHAIQLGFDIDILEIHLNELYPIVDKIFIIESLYSHNRLTKKPLIWNEIKNESRFAKFNDKVVHFVIGDEIKDNSRTVDELFKNERNQEKLRWEMVKEWNDKNHYFEDDDIIGFGDADEICSIQNLNLLRTCEFSGPVDIGTWFTHGVMNRKFYSDFPVPGHRDTLGDPTYFTFKQAEMRIPFPNRNRGMSGKYLLGGMHISRYHYLPAIILKTLSQTEYTESIFSGILEQLKKGDSLPSIEKMVKKDIIAFYGNKFPLVSQESIGKDQFIIPWFLNCNRERYPSLFDTDKYDLRYNVSLSFNNSL